MSVINSNYKPLKPSVLFAKYITYSDLGLDWPSLSRLFDTTVNIQTSNGLGWVYLQARDKIGPGSLCAPTMMAYIGVVGHC